MRDSSYQLFDESKFKGDSEEEKKARVHVESAAKIRAPRDRKSN